ncbi:MAG: UvrD-helicase domain-containing protein, partial [Clostridia bacterium]|nr:UvrD-helicase domain-containing protein [Clostridia bacterium]
MSSNSSKHSWTDKQQSAIDVRNKTILVSAAAGSGKTATLTERIIQRITVDGVSISNMLIVTFTRSAAADLKQKIFKAITEKLATETDPNSISRLSSQLANINNAKISTIDSFYYELVKTNFTDADVSPTFRIIDDGEYKLIAKRTMNEVLDDFYEIEPQFPRFADCFASIRELNSLCDPILRIYSSLQSNVEGIEFLKKSSEELKLQSDDDFLKTELGELLILESTQYFKHFLKAFDYCIDQINTDEMLQKKYQEAIVANLALCQSMLAALKNENVTYEELRAILNSYEGKTIGRQKPQNAELSEKIKALREDFKETLPKHIDKYYSSSSETIKRALSETSVYVDILYRLLKTFDERLTEQKRRLDFLTFNDISRKTYNLLVKNQEPSEIAKKLASEFTDIYIDEYQDVDPLQNEIFAAISTPTNRFMVGDIKQSIYRFRGAEPSLFSNMRKSYPDLDASKSSDCATIFMSDNFRCEQSVILFTNLVCSIIFKEAGGNVDYRSGDDLKFSKDKSKSLSEKATVAVISVPRSSSKKNESNGETNTDDELIALEWEANYIASQIASLIGKEKKADGTLIEPSDIAVLFRKQKMSPYLSKALKDRGIKVAETEATQYFENDDVLMMLCLLNAIDNPERDIYLAGALRSPLFDFSADDLLRIRREYPEPASLFYGVSKYIENECDALSDKCKIFCETLMYWQETAASLPIDRFLLTLFNDERFIASGLLSSQSADGDGGNVLLLYDYARSFQGGGFKGLYECIEYVNSLIEEGQSFPATSKRDSPDRVSLMTIHKSKGLEFPVCFVAMACAQFKDQDATKNLILSYPNSVAMKLFDDRGFSYVTTSNYSLISSKIYQDYVEEEIRVLYVALTRARERLYVVGSTQSTEKTLKENAVLRSEFIDRYVVMSQCKSYIDWILLALGGESNDFTDLKFLTPEDIRLSEVVELEETESTSNEIDEVLYEKLKNSFSFKYPYSELSKIPSKLSVSRLYPDMLDESDESDSAYNLFTNEKPAEIPEFFSSIASKQSPAERGTATHLFLQFCNFEYAATHGIAEELERLCELKFLPESARSLIYVDE